MTGNSGLICPKTRLTCFSRFRICPDVGRIMFPKYMSRSPPRVSAGVSWEAATKNMGRIVSPGETLSGVNLIAPEFGGGEANLKMYQDSIGLSFGWGR